MQAAFQNPRHRYPSFTCSPAINGATNPILFVSHPPSYVPIFPSCIHIPSKVKPCRLPETKTAMAFIEKFSAAELIALPRIWRRKTRDSKTMSHMEPRMVCNALLLRLAIIRLGFELCGRQSSIQVALDNKLLLIDLFNVALARVQDTMCPLSANAAFTTPKRSFPPGADLAEIVLRGQIILESLQGLISNLTGTNQGSFLERRCCFCTETSRG
jgi:hypothetical protein